MNASDIAKRSGLKERLDKIDRETVVEGREKVVALWILEKQGMWRKGREVLKAYPELEERIEERGRGGTSITTFSEVERVSGRDRQTISKWVKLHLTYPTEKEFLAWAKQQGPGILKKWEAHLLPPPRVNGIATPIPPEGLFSVVLADPPWRYDFSPTDSRKVENQYPTMELKDICKLVETMPVADDAALFLWATAPKLLEALQVIDAWGFKYVTHAVWDKEIIGMGYWFRGQHEPLLVATRGHFPPPPESARVSSIIRSRRAAHSEKPEAVYELIESAYVNLSDKQRLEVFARERREGWTPFGNEVASA